MTMEYAKTLIISPPYSIRNLLPWKPFHIIAYIFIEILAASN